MCHYRAQSHNLERGQDRRMKNDDWWLGESNDFIGGTWTSAAWPSSQVAAEDPAALSQMRYRMIDRISGRTGANSKRSLRLGRS
jgi:hypothetical protein